MSPATTGRNVIVMKRASGPSTRRKPDSSHRLGRRSRVRLLAAATLLSAGLWVPVVAKPPSVEAAACTGWSSTTTPPPTIRVLRTATGVEDVVQTVDFETYAKVVMAAEWNPLWHIEALKAGAVAVKEYAWYYTMHWRGGSGSNGCYDVIDNTNDQIYSPGVYTPAASHIQAVEDTWLESVARGGDLFPTGYRTGHDVSCGRDADGAHMFQYSALECALAGKTAEQILLIYYANAVIQGAPTLPGAPADVSAVGYDKSAQVSWSAPTFNGNSAITGYTVTSTPGGKTCTTGGALSCAVSGLNNGTSYRFTVTATNSVGTGPASWWRALAITP